MKEQKEFRGYNRIIILTEEGVIIKNGIRGALLGGGMLRGDKTIPYSSIIAIQLKRAGMTAGYLQLTLAGGSELKKGLFESLTDENSVNFHFRKNKEFEEAKRLIEGRISNSGEIKKIDNLDDLEKLAELKERGVITQEEFEMKKKIILNL